MKRNVLFQLEPGVITKPDTEVLDLKRLLLTDLLNRDDLTSGLLELPQLPKEVPLGMRTNTHAKELT